MTDTRIKSITLLAQADLINWISAGLREPNETLVNQLMLSESERNNLWRSAFLPLKTDRYEVGLESVLQGTTRFNITEIRNDYFRLFHGMTMCPPYESSYIRRDKGAILGDLCGYYRAFGFELEIRARERSDHIVTELEFVSLMLTKTACLYYRDEIDHVGVVMNGCRSFVEEHINLWIESFLHQLIENSHTEFYRNVANRLKYFWHAMNAVYQWGDLSPSIETFSIAEFSEAFTCA